MIKDEDYKLPTEQPVKTKPKADHATIVYLESLPWRPFGVEW